MRHLRSELAIGLLLIASPAPLAADVTGFVGATLPSPRVVVGGSAGKCSRVTCFEFEVTHTWQGDDSSGAPTFWTAGPSLMVPIRSHVNRMRFHVSAGLGAYDESGPRADTGAGIYKSLGGGLTFNTSARTRVRVDYRWLGLGDPDGGTLFAAHVHRTSVGVSIPW